MATRDELERTTLRVLGKRSMHDQAWQKTQFDELEEARQLAFKEAPQSCA